MTESTYTTACPDWERRIVARESIVPVGALDLAEAQASWDIFSRLRVVDIPGTPTMAEVCQPWVRDFVMAIFGSLNTANGRRWIREFFLLISKKNSKSTTAAGIMLTLLLRDFRNGSESAILAPTLGGANNAFAPAMGMVRADPYLSEILDVKPYLRRIQHRESLSTLEVIAADTQSAVGRKFSYVLLDEVHVFGTSPHADGMVAEAVGGHASRPEGAIIYLSTQSEKPPAGVFKTKLEYARAVRDGKVVDPRFLPALFEYPQAMLDVDAHEDPSTWYITNPNLGHSVDEQFLLDSFRQAKQAGGLAWKAHLSKHCNVQVDKVSASGAEWAGARHWHRAKGLASLDEVLARCRGSVVVSVDGGGLDDLCCATVGGIDEATDEWLLATVAFASSSIFERHPGIASRLRDAERAGEMVTYDEGDAELPARELAARVLALEKDKVLLPRGPCVGEDMAGVFVAKLLDGKMPPERIVRVQQGYSLSSALADFEIGLAAGKIKHADNGLLDWMMTNVVIRSDMGGRRMITRAVDANKIDGVSSLLSCVELLRAAAHAKRTAPKHQIHFA